jgi:glucose/arabinose dehydrogenase
MQAQHPPPRYDPHEGKAAVPMSKRLTAIVVVFLVLSLLLQDAATAQFDVPQGFVDESVVGGVPSPTALAWLPESENGDLLIAARGGGIFRFDGSPPANQVLDLSSTVCTGGEMGLLGLAVDPDFDAGDRFVYVYYTDRQGNGSCNDPADRANRVSRFTMNDQDQLVDEDVLIDNISALNGNHNGGDIQFGPNGLLYISVGDAGRDLRTDGTQDDNGNARRLDILNGKILRITPDGGIPAGNPFQGSGTARCSETGQLERQGQRVESEKKTKKQRRRARKRKRKQRRQDRRPATVCREIFATGLRNPYRIAFDPNENQRFYINDVGGNGFEEINDGAAGEDYGWNLREGPCRINSTNCAPVSRFEDPVFAYPRDGPAPFDSCRTITGGAFVPDGVWAPDYSDIYLFADLFCNTVFALRDETTGEAPEEFAVGEGASHLAFGPDGHLYYTAFFDGEIRRIVTTS